MESEIEFLESIKFNEKNDYYNKLMECSECRKTEKLVVGRIKLLSSVDTETQLEKLL